MLSLKVRPHQLESRMREIRPSGSEGGVAITPPSLPLSRQSTASFRLRVLREQTLGVCAADRFQLLFAQGRFFQFQQRRLEVEQRRMGTKEDALSRDVSEQAGDTTDTLQHRNLDAHLARGNEFGQGL